MNATRGERWLGLAWVVAALGCGPSVLLPEDSQSVGTAGDDDPSHATSGTSGTPAPMSTSGMPGTDTNPADVDAGDSEGDADDVMLVPDVSCTSGPAGYPPRCSDCDIFAQDCPEGTKCMPWADEEGGTWNATRCTEVALDPAQPGEPCTVEGNAASGIDTCDFGAMCFYVDPDTNEGTCIAMCTGTPDKPLCAEGSCAQSNGGVLALCMPACNPLGADCPEGHSCVPGNETFWCEPTFRTTGALGDECQDIAQCNVGLICVLGEPAGCATDTCCAALCSLADGEPNPACAEGLTCSPFYEGEAPPGYEDVGVCLAV